jgi:polysaccharide export outer membrane protein
MNPSRSRRLACLARLFAFALVACSAQQTYVWYSEIGPGEASTAVAPGDRIAVSVEQHPELSGEFDVGASGTYNQPLAGAIPVEGRSSSAAAMLIATKLSRYLQDPVVQVTLLSRSSLAVPVLGEVRAPGTYTVPYGSSVLSALGAAGGLSDFAAEDHIFVLRTSPAPLRIRFRYSDLLTPSAGASRFALRDGDAVVVE